MKNQVRSRLTLGVRQQIWEMRSCGRGIREISRLIDLDASIVSREVRRNRTPNRVVLTGLERAKFAHDLAKRRLVGRKRGKRSSLKLVAVREHIVSRLIDKVSPEAISNTMNVEIGIKVSCSTIYRWVKGEMPELKPYLFEKGKKRRQRVMDRRGIFQQAAALKRNYELRPEAAENRSEYGHLEGDTIHSRKGSKAAVVTIRDRKSRVHWFEKVETLEAETVSRAVVRILHRIPEDFRKTVTFDRGSEFANWQMIEKIFPGLMIYFCDPFSPYQKGSNERGNRDFRKHYPKGTDFSVITNEEIKNVEFKVNSHPMKLHSWRSPMELLEKYLKAA